MFRIDKNYDPGARWIGLGFRVGSTIAHTRTNRKQEDDMLARRMATLAIVAGLLTPSITRAATLDDQVRDAYKAWDAAFGKGDANALAALYAEDAIFLPPTHEVLKGPAGVEKFFTGLFAAGVTSHKLELIEANGTPDLIVATARWSAQSKNGPASGLATHEFTQQPGGGLKLRLHTFN